MTSRTKKDTPPSDDRLPIRWALILITSLGGGLAIAALTGPVQGITAGLSIAGLLHLILSR